MKKEKLPHSLRSRLLTTLLLCWVLPVLCVAVTAVWLLGMSYERSAEQELKAASQNALEQLEMRMAALFEDSKSVSYDGVVRNSYRLYQRDGDSAALYRAVTENMNQNYSRNELVPAAFLSFWEAGDVRPYTSSRADLGYGAQRVYRETVEPDLLDRMRDVDTDIVLLEYNGELYIARNLLDSHFDAYATVVLLCDRERVFQSLDPVRSVSSPVLTIDGTLLLAEDGSLRTLRDGETEEESGLRFEGETAGHRFVLYAGYTHFDFWRDVPQIRMAALFVAVLVLPMLLLMFFRFRRYVTKPVETLVEASDRLEKGERGYAITERANSREFGMLFEHFNTMSAELKNQFERSYQEQQALQQAQMKALQSQINPHFLNNTLEIINWEARLAEDERVSAMIEALSVMMDGALARDGRSRIPLREELSYVDAYLYIIRERLGERLEVTREIDGDMLEVLVPRLSLQPLAENAVEHDLTPRRGGKLCLRAYREGTRVVLEVEHEGVLSEEDRRSVAALLASDGAEAANSAQVGLRNVRQRLRLLYGESGELSLTEAAPERILARVSFPEE